MRAFLHENGRMANLAMMAVRLLELHRALKPTGSPEKADRLLAEHFSRPSGLTDHGSKHVGRDLVTDGMVGDGDHPHLAMNLTSKTPMASGLPHLDKSVSLKNGEKLAECALYAWHVTGNPTVESRSRFLPKTIPVKKRIPHLIRTERGARRLSS
jgi:hypothetical protein